MKKILLLIIAVMLTLTINANTNNKQKFEGRSTVATQYLYGYNNVRLQWEDNTSSDGSGENEIRIALTWSQIKELLKKKSNNIWKIRRNNIPATMK